MCSSSSYPILLSRRFDSVTTSVAGLTVVQTPPPLNPILCLHVLYRMARQNNGAVFLPLTNYVEEAIESLLIDPGVFLQ